MDKDTPGRHDPAESAGGSYSEFLNQLEAQKQAKERLRAEARELYSEDGQPSLPESFVAYLDSLGTQEAMKSFTNDDLMSLIQDNDDLTWFLHGDRDDYRQRFLSFSDNVAVGTPVDTSYGDGGLLNTVFSVATYQLNRVVRGRFLRGGIARGLLYMDDRHAVGPALVEAVLVEEKLAIYPRVIVTDEAMRDVGVELAYYADPWESPHNRYLARDADSVFVNYPPRYRGRCAVA